MGYISYKYFLMGYISYNSVTSSEIQVVFKGFPVGQARWTLVKNTTTNYLTNWRKP